MKKEIINKIRKELFKENSYKKKRDLLVSEYINICGKIKDRIFSEKDLDFIKKNQKIVKMQECINIPGCFYNYIEKRDLEEEMSDVKVDFPFLGINFPRGCFGIWNYYFTEEFLTEEERTKLRETCEKIVELGNEYTNKSSSICSSISYNTTVPELQNNFPEAYDIYTKLLRKNGKSKK